MKRLIAIVAALLLSLGLIACGAKETAPDDLAGEGGNTGTVLNDRVGEDGNAEDGTPTAEAPETHEEGGDMILLIGDTPVRVSWEDNRTVEALRAMVATGPLTVSMSMYGGFEQVGSIGRSLPRDDRQITTDYPRHGRNSHDTAQELNALLGQGDVSITLRIE